MKAFTVLQNFGRMVNQNFQIKRMIRSEDFNQLAISLGGCFYEYF